MTASWLGTETPNLDAKCSRWRAAFEWVLIVAIGLGCIAVAVFEVLP